MAEEFVQTPVKTTCVLKLHAGMDSASGKDIIKSVAINNLKVGANADDLYEIGMALAKCLAYPAVGIEMTETEELEYREN